MSAVTIKKISTRRELKAFIRFNYELYKDCPYAVPDFLEDTLDTFNPQKNAAFDFCDVDYFLALREGKIVGRVAAIINHKANQTWGTNNARFGWIDFTDDPEVSRALMDTVEAWGRARGCDKIVGPLGFTRASSTAWSDESPRAHPGCWFFSYRRAAFPAGTARRSVR